MGTLGTVRTGIAHKRDPENAGSLPGFQKRKICGNMADRTGHIMEDPVSQGYGFDVNSVNHKNTTLLLFCSP